MKTNALLLSLFLSILFSSPTSAQNTWSLSHYEASVYFTDVDFTDTNNGIAVGYAGVIRKTSDGGQTWTSISAATSDNILAVDFPGSEVGYAVGAKGIFLKTSDAGASWTQLSLPFYQPTLYDVDFLTESMGFAVGIDTSHDAIILKTTDGGNSWTSHVTPGFSIQTQYGFGADYITYKKVLALSEDEVHVGGHRYSYGGAGEYTVKAIEFDQNLQPRSNGLSEWCEYTNNTVSSLAETWPGEVLVMAQNGISPGFSSSGPGWFRSASGSTNYLSFGPSAHEYDQQRAIHFTGPGNGYLSKYTYNQGYGIYRTDADLTTFVDLNYPDTRLITAIDFPSQNTGYFAGDQVVYKLEFPVSVPEPTQFSLWPNPARSSLHIQFGETAFSGKISLYNAIGQKIKDWHLWQEKETRLDLSELPGGAYLIRAEHTDGSIRSHKLILQP